MVRKNALAEIGIKDGYRLENLGSFFRMLANSAPLLGSELGRFMENVKERFVEFSNVMKEGNPLDAMLFALIQAGSFRETNGVGRNTPYMRSRDRIIRIDRIQQRFHRGCGKPFSAYPVIAFPHVHSAGNGR
jgi:hypothetical protein